MAAIQTAASVPIEARKDRDLGAIVLTAAGGWADPCTDSVYMGGGDPATSVHLALESCSDTRNALETLGVGVRSSESRLRDLATALRGVVDTEAARTDERWSDFWDAVRGCDAHAVCAIIDQCFDARTGVRVLTLNETWEPPNEVLLPGGIVPVDGEDNELTTVDTDFHEVDLLLLLELGVVSEPHGTHEMTPGSLTDSYVSRYRDEFRRSCGGKPQQDYLTFDSLVSSGPLDVLEYLSEGARARFTEGLLDLDETFQGLTMRHSTQDRYSPMESLWHPRSKSCESTVSFRCPKGYTRFLKVLVRSRKTERFNAGC